MGGPCPPRDRGRAGKVRVTSAWIASMRKRFQIGDLVKWPHDDGAEHRVLEVRPDGLLVSCSCFVTGGDYFVRWTGSKATRFYDPERIVRKA